MACPDSMGLERKIFNTMESTASYYLEAAELELFDPTGENVAVFAPAPEQQEAAKEE